MLPNYPFVKWQTVDTVIINPCVVYVNCYVIH